MDTVIRVERVGKQYTLGQKSLGAENYSTLRDALADAARKVLRRAKKSSKGHNEQRPDDFWALRDVSFEVKRGERLAIIGRNGAGKSTLLKIISRITPPTTGRAMIGGRVASLLEVGTGFHPELTGRENVYLNGAILGMTKAEITRKFDEIVAFSEISRFLDTPVKRYSSGMYVRLAFAVAAHLEPEILLVDEVLAVGDAAFQKKCLGKMGEVTGEGRTVLFVSHNMVAVQSLCGRCIWLDKGRVVEAGETTGVVASYIQGASSAVTDQVWEDISTAPGNERVRIRRACVRPEVAGNGHMSIRTPFKLEFEYWNLSPGAHLNLSLHIYNAQGVLVCNPSPVNEPIWHGRPFPGGLFRTVCHIPGDLMNDGMHRVELMVVRDAGTVIYRHDDILAFDIQDDVEMRGEWHGKVPGAVRPILKWSTELLDAEDSPSPGGRG